MSHHIRGCRIVRSDKGWVVKKTVFNIKENAEIYAFYLRICLKNGKKLIYVKDFDEAYSLHCKERTGMDSIGWRDWLRLCWQRNENKYLNVDSAMYAINNL